MLFYENPLTCTKFCQRVNTADLEVYLLYISGGGFVKLDLSGTKIISLEIANVVTLKAGAKHELSFYKPEFCFQFRLGWFSMINNFIIS